jgi:hypothetical protein
MTNPVGRPSWQPTDEQRKMVEAMAGYGVPHDDIAAVLDVAPKTLRKHCDRELRIGKIKANANVGKSLYEQACGAPAQFDEDGNQVRAELPRVVSAAIFWAKAQMGWKETTIIKTDRTNLSEMTDAELEELVRRERSSGAVDEAEGEDEFAGLRERGGRAGGPIH